MPIVVRGRSLFRTNAHADVRPVLPQIEAEEPDAPPLQRPERVFKGAALTSLEKPYRGT
jgi:hypothetical protein